jgi:hypothetical protein
VSALALVHITMPLCRSTRGVPVCTMQLSHQLVGGHADWQDGWPYVVATALEFFEAARAKEHGAAAQLPTLDPAAWRLVLRGHSRGADPVYKYDLVTA